MANLYDIDEAYRVIAKRRNSLRDRPTKARVARMDRLENMMDAMRESNHTGKSPLMFYRNLGSAVTATTTTAAPTYFKCKCCGQLSNRFTTLPTSQRTCDDCA